MLVSACSVNITLVFIMSGGCVTKVHLDTWDLMCLLLSTGIVVSKALGWIVFTTLHNLRILNSSRTTSHAPLSSYSLQSHGTTLHSFSAAESLLVNLRGLASPSLSRAAFQFDVTGLGSGIRSVSSTFLLLLLYGMSFIVVWLSTYFLSDGLPTSE